MDTASDYVPRVSKSILKGREERDYFNIHHFYHSHTLLYDFPLEISFNGGESWQTVERFKNEFIYGVYMDPFHKRRAFVSTGRLLSSDGGDKFDEEHGFYVTEDHGRKWKELYIPETPDDRIESWEVEIHPADRRLLLVWNSLRRGKNIYVSNDAGESFKRIVPPVSYQGALPTLGRYECHFAVSSKESTLERNGIYYIQEVTYAHESSEHENDIKSKGEKSVLSLFYTSDFGRTTKMFEELSGSRLENLFVFPSSVIVLAAERDHPGRKLWISQGDCFKPVPLPDEVISLGLAWHCPGDRTRLALMVRVNDERLFPCLILDPSNLHFSWFRRTWSDSMSKYFKRPANIQGNCMRKIYGNPENPETLGYPETAFAHFYDSDTLIFILDGAFHISFNNGESWQTVDAFRERKVCFVKVDPFHRGRAFVNSKGGKLHVTEDQGRNWKELITPDEYTENSEIYTHPIDRKLLVFHVHTKPDEKSCFCFSNDVIYASDDGGQSVRRISPRVNYYELTPTFEKYDFHFAVSSKESTLENNGIYYIRRVRCIGNLTQENFTDRLELAEEVSDLFYTADFGKSTKVFPVLNGSLIENLFIFPSSVFVLTSEDTCRKIKKLWISKGGIFEPVPLPHEVASLEHAQYCSLGDRRGLVLTVRVNDATACCLYTYWLVIDPLNLNSFFERPLRCSDGIYEDVWRLGNLKGTLWKRIYVDPKNDTETGFCVTKASFDNGKSWTNPRVIDPSRKYEHLFEGDISDLEQCSFQESIIITYNNYGTLRLPAEPTTDIIMKVGIAGKNYKRFSGCSIAANCDMTFISRDGGASWEVAFKFPTYVVFLDFGNIIVATRRSECDISEFYFSLDQGRTWNEYRFDEPVPRYFCIDSLGLKALIRSRKKNRGSTEYIFYSIDFSNIFGGAPSTEDDLERWYLYNGKCIDGVKYSFDRRKADAKCLVRKTFKDLELHEERCES